jgi:hypothetical protein
MSTDFTPKRNIFARDLFDGRLAKFEIHEWDNRTTLQHIRTRTHSRRYHALPLATRPVNRCRRKPVGQSSISLCDLTGCTRARTLTCARNPRGAEKV